MKIEQFEAAGVDFDGTIANTRSAMTESRLGAFLSMASELDDERYALIDPAVHAEAHHHGTHPLEIIGWVMVQAAIISDIHAEESVVQKVVDRRNEIYWDKARHGFDAIDGAIDTLHLLSDYFGSNLHIVTTAPRDEEVVPFLRRYDLLDLFDVSSMVTRHDVELLKPNPDAYLLSMERSGVEPVNYLALEDAHGGVVAARAAKAGTVAALTTTHPQEYFATLPEHEQPTIVTPTHTDFQQTFFD